MASIEELYFLILQYDFYVNEIIEKEHKNS